MRATLSPAFTGSKMKLMFELIVECSEALVAYYREQGDDVAKEWDMKDVFARFSNDVIATCAFGIKVNSSSDRDNEFYRKGKEMMVFTNLKTRLKILGYSFAPRLMNWFGIDLISQERSDYFSGLIRDTVRTREANGIVRPDMVHLLMQSRKGTLTNQQEDNQQQEDFESSRSQPAAIMTESEMIGQCLFFFLAGFDTVSTSMTFLAYELALNSDIQEKLYEEIVATNQSMNKRHHLRSPADHEIPGYGHIGNAPPMAIGSGRRSTVCTGLHAGRQPRFAMPHGKGNGSLDTDLRYSSRCQALLRTEQVRPGTV